MTLPGTFHQQPLFRFTIFGIALACLLLFLLRDSSSTISSLRSSILSGHPPAVAEEFNPDSTLLDDVLNTTLGFQKIFVINLASRTDHRDATSLAAHFTDLELDYVDGVTNVAEKTIPPVPEDLKLQPGGWNAWRAHLNVVRTMVERNISTALILEDDVDWDLRLKSQMRQFAQASQLLLQPIIGTKNHYLDPTLPRQSPNDKQPEDLSLSSGPVQPSAESPYGDIDRWDLLWLGHCGARWPNAAEQPQVPLGRVVINDDDTVPETQHLDYETGDQELGAMYPNHTRVVHTGAGNTCSFAYALTLPGARDILYEFSMRKVDGAYDQMLPDMCVGRKDRKRRKCLTAQPQYFQHYRPAGLESAWSDIDDYDRGKSGPRVHRQSSTVNIRWSAKLNFAKLVDGKTDYVDQFPDGAERPDIG